MVEWCAGYGGIHLGLKRAIPNLRVIAYGEIEAFACANLVAKMEAGLLDAAPIWTDIKTFPCEEFRHRVDILVAGYPCQPFSAAGKRLGTEDPRHLWPHIARSIRVIRPQLCFFENVEGHISLGLSTVVSDLEELGYKVSWGIFSASEVGAPHQRKRVFILAVSNSLGGAAGVSRSLAWNEGVAGVSDNGGSEGCGELADSSRGRFKQCESKGHKAGWISFTSQWPSRPGEPQHGWEPPRVVGHATNKRNFNETEQDHSEAGADTDRASEGAGEDVENSIRSRGEEPEHLNANLPSEPSGRDSESVGNADHGRLASGIDAGSGTEADRGGQSDIEQAEPRQAQPSLGGDADGLTHRLDDAVLHVATDNRTDELRLLGNGVVPATAERAFRVLIQQLDTPPQAH